MLADPPDGGPPEILLLATGSEVALCVHAYETLTAEGVRARVVSMPCWDIFEQQDAAYREVGPAARRARARRGGAGWTLGWDRYVGLDGAIIGMHTFGASAPLQALLKKFGFTDEAVLHAARAQLGR